MFHIEEMTEEHLIPDEYLLVEDERQGPVDSTVKGERLQTGEVQLSGVDLPNICRKLKQSMKRE